MVFPGSYEFFADAGTVASVRLGMDEDGRSRGFGHVEFETAEDAQKALSKSGQILEGRDIFCDLARERGAPPSGGKDWSATYVHCLRNSSSRFCIACNKLCKGHQSGSGNPHGMYFLIILFILFEKSSNSFLSLQSKWRNSRRQTRL